ILLLGHGARGLAAAFLVTSWSTLAVAAALLGAAMPRAFVPARRKAGVGQLLVPEALLGIFGPAYRTGAAALTILAAGQLFNAATGPLGQVINMSGRPYLTLVNNAAVAALNIVLCLILIPRYGLTGAACSTTASLTLVNLVKLAQVRALFGINPFRAETVRAIVAGLAATALTAPLALLVDWPG